MKLNQEFVNYVKKWKKNIGELIQNKMIPEFVGLEKFIEQDSLENYDILFSLSYDKLFYLFYSLDYYMIIYDNWYVFVIDRINGIKYTYNIKGDILNNIALPYTLYVFNDKKLIL